MRRFRKDDIEFHSDGHRSSRPAVNVKIYKSTRDVKLPLDLGSSATLLEDGVTLGPFTTHYTDAGFTQEWIDPKFENDEWLFNFACESAWEYLGEVAVDIFGAGVKVYSEGRSGGWAIVDGIDDDVDSWDAIMVAKWGRFAKRARAIADNVPYDMVMSLYLNEWEQEQADIKAQGENVALSIMAGGH